jgi:ABC-type Fe3+/spermidine/putrescine transport system ATPase subunit
MIAGFVTPTNGHVFLAGRDVTPIPPHRRNLGVVFQNYALFPHMTVFENVAYPLRMRRTSSRETPLRVFLHEAGWS